MGREYDPGLIEVLQNKTYAIEEAGLSITVKPVPDDPRRHVLDPRVLSNARRSASGAGAPPSWDSLLAVRHRSLKADGELAEKPIMAKEFLVDVGDRYIDMYSWEPEERSDKTPAFFFIHGGGFTAGDVTQYRRALAYVAELTGALVLFPDYRLAPEAPFPAAVEDCVACVKHVIERSDELKIDLSRFVIGGDSAGGSLSNACIQLLPEKTFAAAIELYPATDVDKKDPEWSYDLYPAISDQAELAKGRVDRLRGSTDTLRKMYVHGGSLADPLISACEADAEVLAKFPPTTVMTAEYDYLRFQGEKFARLLAAQGVSVHAIRYAGCDHGFFEWPGVRPQTEDACLELAKVINGL